MRYVFMAPDPDLQEFANRGQAAQAAVDPLTKAHSAEQAGATEQVQTSAPTAGTGAQIDEEADARRAAEAKARAEFPPQTVIIRPQPGSDKLCLVVHRFAGGFEAHELAPRNAKEITLKAGDTIVVATMPGQDLEGFLQLSGMSENGPAE